MATNPLLHICDRPRIFLPKVFSSLHRRKWEAYIRLGLQHSRLWKCIDFEGSTRHKNFLFGISFWGIFFALLATVWYAASFVTLNRLSLSERRNEKLFQQWLCLHGFRLEQKREIIINLRQQHWQNLRLKRPLHLFTGNEVLFSRVPTRT